MSEQKPLGSARFYIIKKTGMSGPIILLIAILIIRILVSLLRKTTLEKEVDIPREIPTITNIVKQKFAEKVMQRRHAAAQIMQFNSHLTQSIVLPKSIELVETEKCLLIRGTVEDLSKICDQIALFDELPEGFCMQLGEWHFFSLENERESNHEEKFIVMPRDHWLFASCKLRDSINGYDVHPYNYVYEPFSFNVVLNYGIGVEATDYMPFGLHN